VWPLDRLGLDVQVSLYQAQDGAVTRGAGRRQTLRPLRRIHSQSRYYRHHISTERRSPSAPDKLHPMPTIGESDHTIPREAIRRGVLTGWVIPFKQQSVGFGSELSVSWTRRWRLLWR
jgi:hypothetical protein